MKKGVTRYLETLLVPTKDRKTVAEESDKEGTFTEVTMYAILCGEHVRVQKIHECHFVVVVEKERNR